jgi:hypothetical protein
MSNLNYIAKVTVMITVIDSIMGSGKTAYIINLINQSYAESLGQSFTNPLHQPPRYIYVTPILTEVERIREVCPLLDFRAPQPVKGRKLNHLLALVEEGANVCTTHALFKLLNREIYEALKDKGYTLVIDEALECVAPFKGLTKADRGMLFATHHMDADPESGRLRWNHELDPYSGEFNHVRDLCDNGNLILFRDTVLWEFPADFLTCFDQMFILTYLFSGSPMSAHLRAHGLSYELMTLDKSKGEDRLVPYGESEGETVLKRRVSELITIYEGSANACGERKGNEHPLSSRWYTRQIRKPDQELHAVRASVANWFKKVAQTPARHNAWTCYKDGKKHLTGSPYAKGFIPCNAKGTNAHIERRSLAYLCNLFYQPIIKAYFESRGIEVDEESYALSEMIQWVWRSQIRRYDPIVILVPSDRMRSLLKEWLRPPIAIAHPQDIEALAA